MDNIKLILCSKSARRRKLIKKITQNVIFYSPKLDENIKSKKPSLVVRKLAAMKAKEGAKKFKSGIALGADTIVVCNKTIIGKPKNRTDAINILKKLSGTTHRVYTGIALIDCASGRKLVDYEATRVTMRRLNPAEIKKIAVKHLDKAGAYAVQKKNERVIEKIHGDYYNVVGLPISKVKQMLYRLLQFNR